MTGRPRRRRCSTAASSRPRSTGTACAPSPPPPRACSGPTTGSPGGERRSRRRRCPPRAIPVGLSGARVRRRRQRLLAKRRLGRVVEGGERRPARRPGQRPGHRRGVAGGHLGGRRRAALETSGRRPCLELERRGNAGGPRRHRGRRRRRPRAALGGCGGSALPERRPRAELDAGRPAAFPSRTRRCAGSRSRRRRRRSCSRRTAGSIAAPTAAGPGSSKRACCRSTSRRGRSPATRPIPHTLYAGFALTPYDELWRMATKGGTMLGRLNAVSLAGGAAFLLVVALAAIAALRRLGRYYGKGALAVPPRRGRGR